MDVAFTTVCQIGYAGLVSVKSMKYCCVFLFMREIEVVIKKNTPLSKMLNSTRN